MIIELDTSLLEIIDNISINQLVFLSLVLDKNQKSHQGITPLIRLVSDSEIQDLIDRNLIQKKDDSKKLVYKPTKELVDKLTPKDVLFEQFYTLYPIMVSRPDGTNKLVKGNPDLHNRIITALNFELSDKAMTGKLGYMKTMWKWLTSHEWELIEEQININQPETTMLYGTKLR